MNLVQDYKQRKKAYEDIEEKVTNEVLRIYDAYCEEKNKVSTKSWGKNSYYRFESFSIKDINIHITMYFSYNGGGGAYRYIKLPQSWLYLQGTELTAAIIAFLDKERIDIERREKAAKEKSEASTVKDELELLQKLQRKYLE